MSQARSTGYLVLKPNQDRPAVICLLLGSDKGNQHTGFMLPPDSGVPTQYSPAGNKLPPQVHATLTKEDIGKGNIIIIGDIHGCNKELQDLLDKSVHCQSIFYSLLLSIDCSSQESPRHCMPWELWSPCNSTYSLLPPTSLPLAQLSQYRVAIEMIRSADLTSGS